jgi:hypothetical protein
LNGSARRKTKIINCYLFIEFFSSIKQIMNRLLIFTSLTIFIGTLTASTWIDALFGGRKYEFGESIEWQIIDHGNADRNLAVTCRQGTGIEAGVSIPYPKSLVNLGFPHHIGLLMMLFSMNSVITRPNRLTIQTPSSRQDLPSSLVMNGISTVFPSSGLHPWWKGG